MQQTHRQTEYTSSIRCKIERFLVVQPPSIIALISQVIAGIIATILCAASTLFLNVESSLVTWVVMQCVVSAFVVYGLGLSLQWILISLVFHLVWQLR